MIGETYQLKEKHLKLPKGLKVRLMAIVTTSNNVSICVISSSNGSEWKYANNCGFTSIQASEDLTPNTMITFISNGYLEPVDDFNKIIVWGLAHKWNVRESDHYTKFRKEFLDKNGYDIHENIYKNRR